MMLKFNKILMIYDLKFYSYGNKIDLIWFGLIWKYDINPFLWV